MKQHRYHVTVREIATSQGKTPGHDEPIQFEADSHDDLHDIVARVGRSGVFNAATTPAFVVGLKLLGGVMLAHRDHPLFAEFFPQFKQFMQALKREVGAQQQ